MEFSKKYLKECDFFELFYGKKLLKFSRVLKRLNRLYNWNRFNSVKINTKSQENDYYFF